MTLSIKQLNELLKSTRDQKFRKQTQNQIDRINAIKATNSEMAKNPEWQKSQQEAQLKRKDTGWNKKMIGNKNGVGKRKTKIVQPEHANIKRSETLKGRPSKLKGLPKPKLTCPHCGKEGGKPQMIQYHFDRCKHKPQ